MQRSIDKELIDVEPYSDDRITLTPQAVTLDMKAGNRGEIMANVTAEALGQSFDVEGLLKTGLRLEGSLVYLSNLEAADITIKQSEGGGSVGLGGLLNRVAGDGLVKQLAAQAISEYLSNKPVYDLNDAPGLKAKLASGVIKDVRFDEDKLIATSNIEDKRIVLLGGLGAFLIILIGLIFYLSKSAKRLE